MDISIHLLCCSDSLGYRSTFASQTLQRYSHLFQPIALSCCYFHHCFAKSRYRPIFSITLLPTFSCGFPIYISIQLPYPAVESNAGVGIRYQGLGVRGQVSGVRRLRFFISYGEEKGSGAFSEGFPHTTC